MSDETRPNFEGHAKRECGDHRTVGPHRAWCFDCHEWCYPEGACRGCELPGLRAENERLREALRKLLNRMTDRGSIGGVDSHLRTTWFSVAEVERLRASLSETGGEAQEAPTNVVTLVRGLPVTPEFGHPAWSDGRPILIGDDVLVDEVDALDDDGNEHVMHRVIGWVHSVTPEEIGVVGLWRDSDEIYEASPNELTRRETGGEGA